MTRRAILLIGTEKTGSTTLQQFLALNRPRLAARGFLYPSFCGERNHTGLAAYALDADRTDDVRIPFGVRSPKDVPEMRTRIEAAARAELEGAEGTALFCSEHCHSRLTRPDEIARLHGLLRTFFDEITIAVYLRRQDQVALSLYATQMKSGATHRNLIPTTTADDPYYNYDLSLRMWADVFGEGSIAPRTFDRATLTGGSIIADFCAAWDLGQTDDYLPVPDFNGSIGTVAIEFLRHANARLRHLPGGDSPMVRGVLAGRLESLYPGRGPRPSRAEAQSFYALFRPSNDAVRRRYFADRITLFDEDFDSYPEIADPRSFDLDDATAVALQLHMAGVADVRRLEAEVALRDGRLHWAAQQRREAVTALRRAVRLNPEHPEMHRTLAEYLFHSGQFADAAVAAATAAERRPQAAEYWHFLGMALRRSGRADAAAEAQVRALAIQPDYPAARHELDLLSPSRDVGPPIHVHAATTGRRHAS